MQINTFSCVFTRHIRTFRENTWNCYSAIFNVLVYNDCLQSRKTQSSVAAASTLVTSKSKKAKNKKHGKHTIAELVSLQKKKTVKRYSYVFEESIAKKMVESIICNRVNPKAPVLELSPGIGLVSKEFLRQGVDKVIALETGKAFHPYLESIQQEYSADRFEFNSWDMLNIREKFHDYNSSENGYSYKTKETDIVNSLSRSKFAETETPYSIFTIGGSQENKPFIFYISRNLPMEDPMLKKRVELFFLVHPKFKFTIEQILPTNKPGVYSRFHSFIYTLISLLYDVTFIDEFEVDDFVPSFSKRSLSKSIDVTKRHLMRMQLKANSHDILPLEHHFAFSIFLRHIFIKKTVRIIPVMETLVAGCGLHMMADGFNMMEVVGDVSPDRMLQLYKNMLHWPEYSVSHLKNHIMIETQGGPMEDEEI